MKKAIKVTCGLFFAFSVIYYSLIGYFYITVPSEFSTSEDEVFSICSSTYLQTEILEKTINAAAEKEDTKSYTISMMGIFPVKDVTAKVTETKTVTVSGRPFGIKFLTDGVMVVSLSSVKTQSGSVSPSTECGIKVGDYILSVNGNIVATNEDIAAAVENSKSEPLKILFKRNGEQMTVTVTPALCSDGTYKIGLWVKDSAAGIGTLTYFDAYTKVFAGLGHPICDGTSGEVMNIGSGEITDAEIFGVQKGTQGIPGELKGKLIGLDKGELLINNETGVFGVLNELPEGEVMEVGFKQTISPGKAEIITTVDESGPQRYTIEIEKVNLNDKSLSKNMIIKITDETLLSKTGGIVQGMSGSPIIQNGKFVGAVTHVFVGDPTSGYAIFAENMLATADSMAAEQLKKAS